MTCTELLSCPADLHTVRCARVEADVHRRDRMARCSNEGHDWGFLSAANGQMLRVVCSCCGKSYGVVET